MSRVRKAAAVIGLVLLAGGISTAAALLSGCRAIEAGADALADATTGSTLSGVFRGTARLAESYRDYSTSEEHFIGRAVAAEILSRYAVHSDRKLEEYVNLVGLSVVYGSPDVRQTFAGYRFIVLDTDEVNAVSAPGGFVFVTRGTVRRARDEDELAAILAHEVAHVSLGHGIAAIQAATRKRSGALLLQGVGETAVEVGRAGGASTQEVQLAELTGLFAGAIQDITSELLVKGYSRKDELAADQLAATYLKASGYSRAALASYLGRMDAEGGKGGWFGTHPPASDRVEELGSLAKDDSPEPALGLAIRKKRFTEFAGG